MEYKIYIEDRLFKIKKMNELFERRRKLKNKVHCGICNRYMNPYHYTNIHQTSYRHLDYIKRLQRKNTA